MNKTTWTRPGQVTRNWYIVDATDVPLGRLASVLAVYLMGKHKPNYVPNIDVGDFVIVINAEKVKLTGRKQEYLEYVSHSGYPGGQKKRKVKHVIKQKPEYVIYHAVRGMLPKNALRANYLKRLKIYAGSEHPHEAQNPEKIEV